MTKYELIKLLEPFDDKINIEIEDDNYRFVPRVFYSHEFDEAKLIITKNRNLNLVRTVKLK